MLPCSVLWKNQKCTASYPPYPVLVVDAARVGLEAAALPVLAVDALASFFFRAISLYNLSR